MRGRRRRWPEPPTEGPAGPVPPPHESTTLPATMSAKPSAMRRSTFSWNTNQARSAVKTPSRLRSRDAAEAGVVRRPDMRRIGPRTPPATIAPASHGTSARVSRASATETGIASQAAKRPSPDPAYRSPARSSGGVSPTRTFAQGVLRPKRSAEPIANPAPGGSRPRAPGSVLTPSSRARAGCAWDPLPSGRRAPGRRRGSGTSSSAGRPG